MATNAKPHMQQTIKPRRQLLAGSKETGDGARKLEMFVRFVRFLAEQAVSTRSEPTFFKYLQ